MQAGILDLERSESKNDRKTIFKEEKEREEEKTHGSKKDRRRRIVKKSNGKN